MIDSLALHLEPFPAWLLHTTWQAGILIGLIFLVQKVMGRWLGVRGRCSSLALGIDSHGDALGTPSSISMHNLLPLLPVRAYEMLTVPSNGGLASPVTRRGSAAQTAGSSGSAPRDSRTTFSAQRGSDGPEARTIVFVFLPLVWLAGVCLLAGCIAVSVLRLRRAVRHSRPVTDRRILNLLAECQRALGTRGTVGVIATDNIGSPALFGVLRPRLLVPREILARRGRRELRHIFLHELAHLKRGDIMVGYLATLLHILHWFNPLVALGLHRMRTDRELACDALALSTLHPDETCAYGHTIIRQVERLMVARWRPMLAGLSEDRNQIKQRIAMISRFRSGTYRLSPPVLVLMALLAGTGLTDALPVYRLPVYEPAKDVPTTHQNQHANIVRIHIRHSDTGQYLVMDGDRVACEPNEPGDAGLWEARYEEGFGDRDQVVYFYSVAVCKYLTSDGEGNLAADGLEPNDNARWIVWARPDGAWIMPYPFRHLYLRPGKQGQVTAAYGTDPANLWFLDSLWRIKTSENPQSNPQWQREHIPGPDWHGTWPNWRPPKQTGTPHPSGK